MKRVLVIAVLILAACAVACEDGDWLGPFERGARGAFDGWDMWSNPAVRPYEDPMPPAVPGTVPTVDRFSLEAGRAAFDKMPETNRGSRAALTYRRYCHHCHGPNGDGRIIVGESLELKPADLRAPAVQAKDDQALFEHIQGGGALMLPFAATMSPLEMLLAIQHLRTLKDRPSRPHFTPKNVRPIQ